MTATWVVHRPRSMDPKSPREHDSRQRPVMGSKGIAFWINFVVPKFVKIEIYEVILFHLQLDAIMIGDIPTF